MASVVFSVDFNSPEISRKGISNLHEIFLMESEETFFVPSRAAHYGLLGDMKDEFNPTTETFYRTSGYRVSELMEDPEAYIGRKLSFSVQVWDRFGENLREFVKEVLGATGATRIQGLKVIGLD